MTQARWVDYLNGPAVTEGLSLRKAFFSRKGGVEYGTLGLGGLEQVD